MVNNEESSIAQEKSQSFVDVTTMQFRSDLMMADQGPGNQSHLRVESNMLVRDSQRSDSIINMRNDKDDRVTFHTVGAGDSPFPPAINSSNEISKSNTVATIQDEILKPPEIKSVAERLQTHQMNDLQSVMSGEVMTSNR